MFSAIHSIGLVRANAFHLNVHSGVVRIAHFGNRSVSLEEAGGPSQLVIDYSHPIYDPKSSALELTTGSTRASPPPLIAQSPNQSDSIHGSRSTSPAKIIEALHYMAPEQVSSSLSAVQQDHRADLYSLGMLFWTCIVGKGRLPFALDHSDHGSISPAEVLAALGTERPPLVGEVRSDVPSVIGDIIDKVRISDDFSTRGLLCRSSCRKCPILDIRVHMDSRPICLSVKNACWLVSPHLPWNSPLRYADL